MVENIFRHLRESAHTRDIEHPALHRMRSAIGLHGKFAVIANAATEVNRAIFFSAAIIIAGFVPLFTLSGVEGHIFGPMAKTYAYAIAGGLIATFTISPALSAFLLPERVAGGRNLRRAWPAPRLPTGAATSLWPTACSRSARPACWWSLALFAGSALGLEFLPKLEEGNLWIRATMPPSISLEEGNEYVNRMRAVIKQLPRGGHR